MAELKKILFHKKLTAREGSALFVLAYLTLMAGAYPFYMEQGYVDIGEAKYRFFIYCSLAAAGILGILGAVCCIQVLWQRAGRHELYLIRWENLSATDLFVILYATEIFLSYVLSDYREEALWGTEGWHIGLIPLLVLCGLYFFISRFWDGKPYIFYVYMTASASVFLLGILDRFSVYLIPLEIRDPAFISTLGNINWFCGYLSVTAPVGICRFLFWEELKEKDKKTSRREWKNQRNFPLGAGKALAGIYAAVAFTAGFCQGSSSIFLFFGALFYIILWMAVKKKSRMKNFCLLVILWAMSAQLVRILRILWPYSYNYGMDNLCVALTDSNAALLPGAAALLLLFLISRKETKAGEEDGEGFLEKAVKEIGWKTPEKAMKETGRKNLEKEVHRLMAAFLAAGFFLWLGISCMNTWKGISFFSQKSLFLLNENWGNGRGAALKAGFQMYGSMPFGKKIIGVGPDCFSAYAYSLPEVARYLRECFGSERLTNAHNELVTCLVNTGMAGTILYFGIFVSFVVRCVRKGAALTGRVAMVCIVCYLVHNLVSFAQVLNLPFVFFILGMGEREIGKL